LHECGHAELSTNYELEADNWALQQYLKMGNPLTEALHALTDVLNFRNKNDYDRVHQQFNNIVEYDIANGNEKLKNTIMNYPQYNEENMSLLFGAEMSDFKLGQKIGNFIRNVQSNIHERKMAKIEKGTNLSGLAGSALGGVFDTAGNLLGTAGKIITGEGGETIITEDFGNQSLKSASGSNNRTWLIVAGIAVVIVIGIVIFMKTKKSK
jgi:hypothetical protein